MFVVVDAIKNVNSLVKSRKRKAFRVSFILVNSNLR